MQQNKTRFFIIIGVAAIAVVGMIAASFLLTSGALGDVSALRQNIEISVVVAPPIEPWAEQAAQAFNQANPETPVKIVTALELIPGAQFRTDQAQSELPAAWIAEASFVVEMARDNGLQFEEAQSVASDSLAWGGYQDKLAQFSQNYGDLTWQNLHAKATGPDGLKLVIASPHNSAAGIAALASATAGYLESQTLSSSDIGAADAWLTETLGNRNATTPPTPAESFASVQGRTLGDAGLLSLAAWQKVKLDQAADFSLSPAEPNVTLDYPFVIWNGAQANPKAQEVARSFRSFLLGQAQQDRLADYFFGPAATNPGGVQIDGATAVRLQSWANRVLR